jgi:hypothetical protein
VTLAPNRSLLRLGIVGATALVLVLATRALHLRFGDPALNALLVTQACWLGAPCSSPAGGGAPGRPAPGAVADRGLALALRLGPLLDVPFLSTDAFRYVWDGRVQAAGINPYRYIPAAPELAPLRDAAIFPFINRANYAVTIYPPAAQMLFALVGQLGDSMLVLKLAFTAIEALAVLLLLDLLRRTGQPLTRIAAYAWHPLAVWEIAGNGHVDGPMVAVMVLGIWLAAVLRRPVAAAAVIAVAALMKPLAAIALPLAWRPWDWKAPAAAIGTVALLYLPYLSVGAGMFSFVGGYLREEKIESGQGFFLVEAAGWLIGSQPWLQPLYLALAAAVLLALMLRLSFAAGDDAATRLRRLGFIAFAAIFFLSPGYPWYSLVLLPFLAVAPTPALWAASIGCMLLYNEIHHTDLYVQHWVRDGIYNLAMLVGLALSPSSAGRRHSNAGSRSHG